MDFLKKVASEALETSSHSTQNNNNENKGENNNNNSNNNNEKTENNNDLGSKILSGVNSALGGGAKGEQKEDGLDKAIDFVQEHVFKMGSQDNESAVDQATDKQIASAIRTGYKTLSGKEFPIAEQK